MTLFAIFSATVLFAAPALARDQSTIPAVRAITHVRGDLYRMQDGEQFTVFLVTDEGIILADPLNRAAALWLKEQLADRFPNRAVRYVVHTEHRFHRAGGSAIFSNTATRIAHKDFNATINHARKSLPPLVSGLDRNGNGRLEPAETAGAPLQRVIDARDFNGDGVTTMELHSDIATVQNTYESDHVVTLGGKSVRLIHAGTSSLPESTLLYFPAERVLFAADYQPLDTLPPSFSPSSPKDVLAWLRAVESLDFDALVSGRDHSGSRSDVKAVREYIEDLVARVGAGVLRRESLPQLQTTLVDRNTNVPNRVQRRAHVSEVYRDLRRLAINGYATGQVSYFALGNICTPANPCKTVGGAASDGLFGFALSVGRVAAAVESTVGSRIGGHLRRQLGVHYYFPPTPMPWVMEHEFEHRFRAVSTLFRYDLFRNAPIAVAIGGGPAVVTDGSLWITRDLSFSREFVVRTSDLYVSWTAGADIVVPLGNRVGLTMPIRTTRLRESSYLEFREPVGRWSIHAGAGLTVTLWHGVR